MHNAEIARISKITANHCKLRPFFLFLSQCWDQQFRSNYHKFLEPFPHYTCRAAPLHSPSLNRRIILSAHSYWLFSSVQQLRLQLIAPLNFIWPISQTVGRSVGRPTFTWPTLAHNSHRKEFVHSINFANISLIQAEPKTKTWSQSSQAAQWRNKNNLLTKSVKWSRYLRYDPIRCAAHCCNQVGSSSGSRILESPPPTVETSSKWNGQH